MSRAVWILAVLLSHWRRHPMQLATLLIGLISATALWSGVQALNQQARDQLRPRRRDLRRRANRRCWSAATARPFPQAALCRPAPRRLAGLAGARRPRSDRRTLIPAARHRADHAARPKSAMRRAIGRAGSAILPHAARAKRWSRRKRLPNSILPEGATPPASDGTSLPPLRVQAQLVPGVLVVDIGIAQQLLNMPDQISRLLIGKAKGKRAPLESVAGDQLRLVAAGCRERSRTPDRQLSPQPDRVRPAVVRGRAVHRQFGDRACVRAAAADAADLARLRRVRAHAERGAGGRTGVAGAGRGRRGTGLRLSDRGRAAARCRGIACAGSMARRFPAS